VGLGVSALLFGWLGQRPASSGEPAPLRRLGWMLLAECLLFAGLTLVVRFPRLLG
jgi:hypothetical protein